MEKGKKGERRGGGGVAFTAVPCDWNRLRTEAGSCILPWDRRRDRSFLPRNVNVLSDANWTHTVVSELDTEPGPRANSKKKNVLRTGERTREGIIEDLAWTWRERERQ